MMPQTQHDASAPETARMQTPEQEPNLGGLLSSVIDESARLRRDKVVVDMAVYAQRKRLARMFVDSGFFESERDKQKTPLEQAIAQAMVRIELGASMGFTEAESMQGIDIIQGRPAISAQIRAAKMQEAGFDWDIQWHAGKDGGCAGITLWLKKLGKDLLDRAGQPVSVSYLESDARSMLTTIWADGTKKRVSILEKDNWKMSPRNMYFARAITNAQRWYAPGALKGVAILSREEAQDIDQIVEETERRPVEPLQPPKLKAAAFLPPESSAAATDTEPGNSADLDPSATVTDARAEEIRALLDEAKMPAKARAALWSQFGVANAYSLSNASADLIESEMRGRREQ